MPDDPRKVLKGLEGSLCYDPTDVSADYPHGGTGIGLCRDMVFTYGEKHEVVTAEEYGSVVVEAFRYQESPIFTAVLREWRDDAFAAIFPDTTTGTSNRTSVRGVVNVNDRRSGRKLSDFAVKLLFSPKALDKHPWIVIYNAIPVPMDAVIDTRLDREVGIAVGFYGIPDATGRLFQVEHRGGVTL